MPTTIFLKPGKEEALRRRHPWVFSGAVARTDGPVDDGAVVQVCNRTGEVLGVGHFHKGSIAVRVLAFAAVDIEQPEFWQARLTDAWAARQTAGMVGHEEQTNCFRWVHGEGDGLSGLIVDVYGGVAVVQCHSIGMHRQRTLIAESIRVVMGNRLVAIYDKSVETLPNQYASTVQNSYLWGEPQRTGATVLENGVQFRVDWETGQKTGFFLDQRDNRQLLAQYAAGKTVLNTFCYTGGFSAYALRAGATHVDSVDVSAKAMALTEENVRLNLPYAGQHTGFTEDVLVFLKRAETLYDVVIVDPPAYAKTLDKRHNAVQGYKRLNAAALQCVKAGGLLFTFSCSQVVDRDLFYHTVAAAAIEVGRPVRVLHHLSQGADHPVSLFHAEGAYLKGLVLLVG